MSHEGDYLLRCPRCGLDNASDVTECARCGLPVYGPAPVQPEPGQPPRRPEQQPPPYSGQQRPPTRPGGASRPGVSPPDLSGPGVTSPAAGRPAGAPGQSYGGPAAPAADAPSWGPQWPSDPTVGGHPGSPSPAGVGEQPGPSTYGIGNPMPPGPNVSDQAPMVISQPMRPTAASRRDGPVRATLARVILGLALVATVVYSVWELTGRRAIFGDFADGRAVTLDRARTNDRIDNILLAIAASLAVIAFLVWVVRRMRGRTAGGALDAVGLTLWLLGGIAAAVGLVLLETVDASTGALAQGRHAETYTILAGVGFAVVALSLAIGLSVQTRATVAEPAGP